ncbi:MAG: hypothetical protein ACRES2_06265 [Steroidobacteraceae bacterium]
MTLEETFYLSQTVASVAVVGSLIYLGLQVRYAERAQRGIMQQGRADRTSQAALTLAQAELSSIWHRGAAGDQGFSREEFGQWMLLCRAAFLSGEDSFMQHKAGLLSDGAFASYVAGVRYYMSSPGLRAAWQVSSGQFGSEFVTFVNGELARTPLAPATDTFAKWTARVRDSIDSPEGKPLSSPVP